jgi:hypothetical protein
VTLALIAAGVFAVTTVRESFPQTSGDLDVPGLEAEVSVLRDNHGIPQIYADTAEDLFFAQGFVQAQDRFYEMDVRRHSTSGRLSELFGEDTLEIDKVVRTLGWRRVAEAEVEKLSPDVLGYLEAFSAGVNAYVDDRSPGELSLEYTLLTLGGLDYEGLGPARQHAGRDRPGDGLDQVECRRDRAALPSVSLRPAPSGRRRRGGGRRGIPGRRTVRSRGAASGRAPSGRAAGDRQLGAGEPPHDGRPRRRCRQQRVGGRR